MVTAHRDHAALHPPSPHLLTPAYGARPLKRAIQRYIEDPMALEIPEGRFSKGDTVRIDRGEGSWLTFQK